MEAAFFFRLVHPHHWYERTGYARLEVHLRLQRTILRGESRFRLPAIPSGNALEKWGYYFFIDAKGAADAVVMIFWYSVLA